MSAKVGERLARGADRQLELPSIRRDDVRDVTVLCEVARGGELGEQIAAGAQLARRGVHGARGYTIGWLGTASPPMAGTNRARMHGPSWTSSGTKASSVMVARERDASPRAVLPRGRPKNSRCPSMCPSSCV